jgi:acyl-CoA thioester hydrolase
MSEAFVWPVRVYWEDTDASGVAYHASYLRWFERGRTEWLRALGGGQQQWLEAEDLAFTVSELAIRYRRPARLDDLLEVHTRVAGRGRASLRFRQTLMASTGSALLAEAEVRAACVSRRTFRPRALPALLLSVTIGADAAAARASNF